MITTAARPESSVSDEPRQSRVDFDRPGTHLRYLISLAVVLAAVWLAWSGLFKTPLLILGAISCLFVVMLSARMRVADPEGAPVEVTLRALLYAPWLLWEIFKANVDVALRIVNPSMPISPRMIRIRANQQSDLGRVIYANSITLTPGTVSVDLEGDEIIVHALTRQAAEGLSSGEMDRRVTQVEGNQGETSR